jgi:hypothetical protein
VYHVVVIVASVDGVVVFVVIIDVKVVYVVFIVVFVDVKNCVHIQPVVPFFAKIDLCSFCQVVQ